MPCIGIQFIIDQTKQFILVGILVLVLVFMPVIGLVFYIFFGRTHRRDQIISRRSYSKLLKRPEEEYRSQQDAELPADYEGLISLFNTPIMHSRMLIIKRNYLLLELSG